MAIAAPRQPEADDAPLTFGIGIDRRSNVAEQIYTALRDAIVSVQLPPGASISENRICRHAGVSRTPVRAAIIRLVDEELIDVFPQQGSFVAPIKLAKVYEGHFIRKALELAILQRAAPLWDAAASTQAHAILACQQRLVGSADVAEFYKQDVLFHQWLARVAGVSGVWRAIQSAKAHLDRVHRLAVPVGDRMSGVCIEHAAILAALDAGDREEALAALEAHLDTVFETIERLTGQHSGYFEH